MVPGPYWLGGESGPEGTEIKKLEDQYTQLFYWLCEGHVDFDYGDEDFLKRMGAVEKDANGARCCA